MARPEFLETGVGVRRSKQNPNERSVNIPAAADPVKRELRLYFTAPITLDSDEIAMINTLAGQGALAIRHSLLHRQYFETFRAVSTAIHSGQGVAEILESIAGQITEIMGAIGCIYWIVDETQQRIVTSVAQGFAYRSLAGADFQTLDRLFRIGARQVVHIADARTDERIPDLERLRSRLIAPAPRRKLDLEIFDRIMPGF